MDEKKLEAEIQAKGLNAPRLTPALIDAAIRDVQYHVFPGSMMTVCCLTLQNGFTVIGESACASPANFDAEIGQKVAFDKARNEIWKLEGYLLRDRLWTMESVSAAKALIDDKKVDHPGTSTS